MIYLGEYFKCTWKVYIYIFCPCGTIIIIPIRSRCLTEVYKLSKFLLSFCSGQYPDSQTTIF